MFQDLIKCTPTEHADYDMLQKTLKISQNFLETQQPGQSEKVCIKYRIKCIAM